MLAPVVTGMPVAPASAANTISSAAALASAMAPPSSTSQKTPIFGQSAKVSIEPHILPRSSPLGGPETRSFLLPPLRKMDGISQSEKGGPGGSTSTPSPLVTNSLNSNSFAALAQAPDPNAVVVVKDTPGTSGTSDVGIAPAGKSPTKQDKVTDIDALKKKLALMERETTRLREMHKLRLKKLETKQRAQEELRKRDAEIQRRQDEEDARTVYVRNLHPKINEQQLREHFSMFGAIKRIVLPQDAHQIGSNRGFTFITFASKEPVEVACSLDGTLLHERSIKVVPKTNMMGKMRPQHLH